MAKDKDTGSVQEILADTSQAPQELVGPKGWLLRRPIWIDMLVFLFIAGGLYVLFRIAPAMTGPRRPVTTIDLSAWALPKYLAFSVFRGFAAYFISLGFTLIYAYIAATNRRAEKLMVPILDILQSIPVLGFMPALVLGFVALFPESNLGLELVAILLIFTGQVWNMTFSFYHSLKSIPAELRESATIYGFGWWRRFTRLELPFAAVPLTWNSMVGMAGGWFFLTICEGFQLGEHDFRLPGIGSYMSVAIHANNVPAMIYGIAAMMLMIIVIDRLFWRPIITWAQKFKYEFTAPTEQQSSIVLDLLRQSAMVRLWARTTEHAEHLAWTWRKRLRPTRLAPTEAVAGPVRRGGLILLKCTYRAAAIGALGCAGWGTWQLWQLVAKVDLNDWLQIGSGAGLTLLRVTATLVLASLWTIPVGVMIGVKPKLSARLQPVIQIVAAFPAPMIYPLALKLMLACGISLQVGAVFLLMLGTQWYILFNAIAGAMSIPQDLKETCSIYKITGRRRWQRLYLPAVLSSLVTGWIAAAGGAWNTSIVAEYMTVGETVFSATGLGAIISTAAERGDFAVLAAAVLVMALMVVIINRIVWRPIFRVASQRFAMNQ